MVSVLLCGEGRNLVCPLASGDGKTLAEIP